MPTWNVFQKKEKKWGDGFIYSLALRTDACLFNDIDNCYVAFMVDAFNTDMKHC